MTPSAVVARLPERLQTPHAQRLLRYSAASAISVVLSVILLIFFDGVLHWGAVASSTAATAIVTIPSYTLNRRWAWGKDGRSHLVKEVLPFWILAFIGWAFSTYSVRIAESELEHSTMAHIEKTMIVAVVYIGAFGVLWVAKFVIFNKVLFVHRPAHSRPVAPIDAIPG